MYTYTSASYVCNTLEAYTIEQYSFRSIGYIYYNRLESQKVCYIVRKPVHDMTYMQMPNGIHI